jgi:hypothetical protein
MDYIDSGDYIDYVDYIDSGIILKQNEIFYI